MTHLFMAHPFDCMKDWTHQLSTSDLLLELCFRENEHADSSGLRPYIMEPVHLVFKELLPKALEIPEETKGNYSA